MDAQFIAILKEICIEEASNFQVPPALIDVIIVRQLFKTYRKPLIVEYLKSGALFRLLKNSKGPFVVLLDRDQPTVCFADGTLVRTNYSFFYPWISKWDTLIFAHLNDIKPGLKERIIKVVSERITSIVSSSWAYS